PGPSGQQRPVISAGPGALGEGALPAACSLSRGGPSRGLRTAGRGLRRRGEERGAACPRPSGQVWFLSGSPGPCQGRVPGGAGAWAHRARARARARQGVRAELGRPPGLPPRDPHPGRATKPLPAPEPPGRGQRPGPRRPRGLGDGASGVWPSRSPPPEPARAPPRAPRLAPGPPRSQLPGRAPRDLPHRPRASRRGHSPLPRGGRRARVPGGGGAGASPGPGSARPRGPEPACRPQAMAHQERTFIAIKPDGVQRGLVGDIVKRFEQKGFRLVAMKFLRASEDLLKEHYIDLKDRPFYPGLVKYMHSGPVVAMVWEGLNVVKTGRMMLGETNPADSKPGTIRGDFCIQVGRNIIHGSDSVKSAEKEISLWFKPEELVDYKSCAFDWIYE
uniref:Nucleoside diphosphate kinase n=1 Tax=Canis lupus dingo TaxID=286419 RepID=A0A8C0LNP2_CANLU